LKYDDCLPEFRWKTGQAGCLRRDYSPQITQITPITLELATSDVRENNLRNLWIIP
jgi:hypothetical protein